MTTMGMDWCEWDNVNENSGMEWCVWDGVKQSTGHTHTGHTDRENTPDTGTQNENGGNGMVCLGWVFLFRSRVLNGETYRNTTRKQRGE